MPAGNAVFAWTWYEIVAMILKNDLTRRQGQSRTRIQHVCNDTSALVARVLTSPRNCASVKITKGSPSASPSAPATKPVPTSFIFQGCKCTCTSPNAANGCTCECDKPTTRRHLVERKVFALYAEDLRRRGSLNVPIRRAEVVAFNKRPDMLFLDVEGANCRSPLLDAELKFPNPGPDEVLGDGEYPLQLPRGSCVKKISVGWS
jgi:hypothetical protein